MTDNEQKLIESLQQVYLHLGKNVPSNIPAGLKYELQTSLHIIESISEELKFDLPYQE